jgi:hypothetical protein
MILTVTAAEVVCRKARFNFTRLKHGDLPIYFRPPTVHIGNGVFRRPGPATWRGQPMVVFMKHVCGTEGPYSNEAPIRIDYDAMGFRNPPDLRDWEIVVTGDSFVELGFIAHEDLFTTVAARKLGVRIKNLGVAATGTIFQTFYFQNYGKAPSARDAVLCFFEGNDLIDFDLEMRKTNVISRRIPVVLTETNNSLLDALITRWTRKKDLPSPDGFLRMGDQEHPMTLRPETPPIWNELTTRQKELVLSGMKRWAEAARAHGMRPWVMCIPDSRRVFHGHIRFMDTNSPTARWEPGEFASQLATICEQHSIRFIDAFPALRRETEAGAITYNIFRDAHLNAHGSRVVGDVLASALKDRNGARTESERAPLESK